MIRKLLVANRGEIAVRVIRTCHEIGIETVAVFSEVDRSSPHVLMASEAYSLGQAPSTESYLRMDGILEVANKSGADAVHPGYGFLSESADFAGAVKEAGLTWIGPPQTAMAQMGDKVAARNLATDVGVPVVPGSEMPVPDEAKAVKIAESMGFPVLIKAVGGGGGKGMRIVNSTEEMADSLERAASEAGSAFSDDRIYVEKYFPNPRHVEIQIIADSHGNCLALTERECSIQRRYQKIIEESPSPFINRKIWSQMAKSAREIITRSGYAGVGTVEFLVDEKKHFYFLEVNARLQVEHPVTEMITGIDLVREQIRMAEGQKLLPRPEQSKHDGHAIECRVYAEDGFAGFIPSTGTISGLDIPNGFGIRFDHGIRLGQEITPYYDPLLGKIVVWGEDRNQAIDRMKRALEECYIVGIDTTVPFCFAVVSHPRFRSGDYTTAFISQEAAQLRMDNSRGRSTHRNIASVLTAVHDSDARGKVSPNGRLTPSSRWKTGGRKDALR